MNYIYSLFLFSSLVLAQDPEVTGEESASGEEGSEGRPGDVDVREDMSSQSMEQKGFVAPYRVISFIDRKDTGDCDRIDARYGRCVEIVDLGTLETPWILADNFRNIPKKDKAKLLQYYPSYYENWSRLNEEQKMQRRKESFAQWKAYGTLYTEMWEDLTYRWKENDPKVELLKDDGFKTTPTPKMSWDNLTPYERRSFAVPEGDKFWDADEVIQPVLPLMSNGDPLAGLVEPPESLFRLVKYALPENNISEPIASVMLAGRFALRLGFNNRSHDYDMMDGDPKSSGPFFEQLYPYQTIYEADNQEYIPLYNFKSQKITLGKASKSPMNVTSLEEAYGKAITEFGQFYRLVATQVLQFSMQDYTINHMRILASLTNMRTPPGSLAEATGISRNLNASAQGMTDDRGLQESRIDEREEDSVGIPEGFRLNYQRLPDIIVVEWLQKLEGSYPPPPNLYYDITQEAQYMFGELLSSRRPTILESLSDKALKDWVSANAGVGVELEVLLKPLRQLSLEMMMETLSERDRDIEQTWLLLDHVNYSIASNLDDQVGVKISPSDFSSLAADRWETVLGDHYHETKLIPQGLGAIDPTAVCTTKDRTQALKEEVVGAIYVDQLFLGVDKDVEPSVTNEDLLWEAREELSFVMLDNPAANEVKLERLVGVPDGKAIYRARWKIWSGWHLLWGVQNIAGKDRLILRTSAICENMILTSPKLAPTILRAGFLYDDFFPTDAVVSNDLIGRDDYVGAKEVQKNKRQIAEDRKELKDKPSRAEVTREALGAADTVLDVKKEIDILEGDVENLENLDFSDVREEQAATTDASSAIQNSKLGLSLDQRNAFGRKPYSLDLADSSKYVHELVYVPFEEFSSNQGLMLMIFDVGTPKKRLHMKELFARTPYILHRQRVSWNNWLRVAGWGIYFDKDVESQKVEQVVPNYENTESYVARAPMPTFKRPNTTDVTFVGDVGFFPWRKTNYSCIETSGTKAISSVETCDPNQTFYSQNEGFSFSFATYTTTWFRPDPRLAFEAGIDVHLDVLHAGSSWFYKTQYPNLEDFAEYVSGDAPPAPEIVNPTYSISFRPHTGASVGIRHALDPSFTSRVFRRRTPWGADDISGLSNLTRYEWGIRGGFLIGPGYSGLEYTIATDVFLARSIRSNNSDWANFTGYHPIWTGGPFVRYQYGNVLVPTEEERFLELQGSHTAIVGWRTHFRTREERPE